MEYNLALNSSVNTSASGTVSFDISDTNDLLTNNLSYEIGNGDELILECDLGKRIKINEVRYYFSSSTSSGTIASDISFYYMNDAIDGYLNSEVNIGSNFYYTVVSGQSAPRWIRVTHSITNPSISGTINGFEVINDDTIVDFGSDGSGTSETLTTYLGAGEQIISVPIFNSGSEIATAYVYIEPQYSEIDNLIYISSSSSGPWYGLGYNTLIEMDDEESWSCGTFDDTEVGSDSLIIVSPNSVGTYTTRIFDNTNLMSNFFIVYDEPEDSIVSKDDSKVIRTFEVRHSEIKPINFHSYRKIIENGSAAPYLYEYYCYNGSTYYSKAVGGSEGSNYSAAYYYCSSDNEDNFYALRHLCGSSFGLRASQFILTTYNKTTDTSYRYELNSSSVATSAIISNMYFIQPNSIGGCWIYVSSNTAVVGKFLNAIGYYLCYFTNTLTNTLKSFDTSNFIYDMSVVYDSYSLWYTNIISDIVINISNNGDILYQYADANNTNDLRGVASLSDGGCFFINGKNIHRLDDNGELVDTFSNIGSNPTRIRMSPDYSYFYIIDGAYIKKFNISGAMVYSHYTSNSEPTALFPVKSGVWYKAAVDDTFKFLEDASMSSIYSISISSELNQIWPIEYEFDDTVASNRFPVPNDSEWGPVQWDDYNYENYNFTAKYNQIRLTLRASSGLVSPEVEKISVSNYAVINNIYPGSSKNVYIKLDTPDSGSNYIGNYSTNLKVMWKVDV